MLERQANRLRYLNALYEAVDGSQFKYVSFQELGAELGIDPSEVVDIVQYLAEERLVETTNAAIALSHRGLKEVEAARLRPNEPTEHFPASVNIINVQSMVGSVIQQAGAGSLLTQQTGAIDAKALREFIQEIRTALADRPLASEISQEFEADAQAVESQLNSPRPKLSIVREALRSIRSVAEGALGSAVASALISHYPQVLGLLT